MDSNLKKDKSMISLSQEWTNCGNSSPLFKYFL